MLFFLLSCPQRYYKFSGGNLWDPFTEPEGKHQWCKSCCSCWDTTTTLPFAGSVSGTRIKPRQPQLRTQEDARSCAGHLQSAELEHLALGLGSAASQLCDSDFHLPKAVFSYVTITQKLCYYVYCCFHIIFIFLTSVLSGRDYFIHLKVKDTAYAPRGTTNN